MEITLCRVLEPRFYNSTFGKFTLLFISPHFTTEQKYYKNSTHRTHFIIILVHIFCNRFTPSKAKMPMGLLRMKENDKSLVRSKSPGRSPALMCNELEACPFDTTP